MSSTRDNKLDHTAYALQWKRDWAKICFRICVPVIGPLLLADGCPKRKDIETLLEILGLVNGLLLACSCEFHTEDYSKFDNFSTIAKYLWLTFQLLAINMITITLTYGHLVVSIEEHAWHKVVAWWRIGGRAIVLTIVVLTIVPAILWIHAVTLIFIDQNALNLVVGKAMVEGLFPILTLCVVLLIHIAFTVPFVDDVSFPTYVPAKYLSDGVCHMLLSLKMGRHKELFLSHGIDDSNVELLDKGDLLHMGLPVGDALKVLRFVRDGYFKRVHV